jgi:adenylate kinase family enzyme
VKRILVLGSGGAGKSTFSRRLSLRLGIPVVHLDALYWRPGWSEPPVEEWKRIQQDAVARDTWIMDGNYSNTIDARLAACDTVIFLDLPRTLCLWRVIKRSFKYRGRTRPDMAAGCNERIDLAFLKWVWRYPQRSRPRILALLDEHRDRLDIHRLRSSSEIENFLAQLSPACNCVGIEAAT